MSARRVRAILRKELREYRRNRQIVVSMAVLPLLFSVYPFIEIFALPASAAGALAHKEPLIYMLAIPAIVPAAVTAYSVAGERQQGTLEPVLTTPIRREEFLLGKALAALVPALAVSYGVVGVFVACIGLFAKAAVVSAVLRGPELLAQLLFTPLVTAWSIWVGIAISARSSDPRGRHAAQRARELPLNHRDHPRRDRRGPRNARPRARPRGRNAAPRRPRLADRVPDVRPRAAHNRDQIVK
jgi:ABC-type transport system involved in multi-copper enzyme maturation permease subunit